MREDMFKSVLGYLSAMAQAKCLLRQGIITQKEFTQIEKMFYRKYHLGYRYCFSPENGNQTIFVSSP